MGNMLAEKKVETLGYTLAKVEVETLGKNLAKVDFKALIHTLASRLTDVQAAAVDDIVAQITTAALINTLPYHVRDNGNHIDRGVTQKRWSTPCVTG